jgi:Eco57I restriction-modification methylase
MNQDLERLRSINSFPLLVTYLRDALGWEFETEDIEDLTYDYTVSEFGLDPKTAAKIRSIKQLIPLVDKQPWGIFYVDFAGQNVSVAVLRGILRSLVAKKRASANRSEMRKWRAEDLLFICTSDNFKNFNFAYFRGAQTNRAVLSTFGWHRGDTHLRTLHDYNLGALRFPSDTTDAEEWLKRWRTAFDVERVTERFFTSYRDAFERVETEVRRTIRDYEHARLYTQRLFNRLMFIYFIQKKGWLTFNGDKNYLRALFAEAQKNSESFLRDRLYWLFFYAIGNAALITNPQQTQFLESKCGVVPFLNGGLFDIEDDYDAKLSTEIKFEAAEVEISNRAFARVLELFEHYNFTIEESTPLEVQVAVDPEMLGKVFEELVTGRHETGSYYTPRPVVSFMCREALKHYLARTGSSNEAASAFVDDEDTTKLSDPEAVLEALKQVRVCDPACGSGAYLLGMLQELMRLRAALFKEYKIDFDKLYDRKREIIERNLFGVDKDKFAVQIACLRLWLSLAIESENPKPLPNLDFKIGCDDSLTAPPPRETQPDMFRVEKVRTYQDKKAQFLKCDDPDRKRKLREEIEALRDEIAVALKHQPPVPNPQRVKLAKDRAEELTKEIRRLVRANDKANAAVKQGEFKKLKRQLDAWEKATNADARKIGFDWAVEFAEIFMPQVGETWRIDDLHPLLNDFKSQPTLVEEPETEDGGFDIVVANPPYVRADAQFKHIKNEKERQAAIEEWKAFRADLLKSRFYETLYEKWDLYLPFLERAYQLLREGGDMVFIISDAYNAAKYANRSHSFFVKNSSIERLDFCSEIPLFKAGVNNTIVHFSRSELRDDHEPTRIRRWGDWADEFDRNADVLPTAPQTEFGPALFRPDAESTQTALAGNVKLGRICYVSVGMVIHCDEKKAQGLFKGEDLISEERDAKHPKQYVEGKDIARWNVKRVRFLEYGTRRAPAMFRRPTFPELHRAKARLLAVRMCGAEPAVAYDKKGLLSNHTAIIFIPWHELKGVKNKSIKKTAKYSKEVKPKETRPVVLREELEEVSRQFEPKYLLAVMNSSFAKNFVNERRRSKLDIYPDDWKPLPIIPIPLEQQQVFVRLVDKILAEFEENGYPLSTNAAQRVKELEHEVDEGVDELYAAPPEALETEGQNSGATTLIPFA